MRVRDVISPTLCVRSEEASAAILDKMRTACIEHIIVTHQRDIVGVTSARELALASAANADALVGEFATAVPVLAPDALIKDAANLMRSHRVGCVPVIQDGVIAGVITADRLLELIGRGAIHAIPNRERRVLKDRGPKRRSRDR